MTCNSLADVVLLGMLSYKAIKRSCVFNNFKTDRKVLFCVALLDLCKFACSICFARPPCGEIIIIMMVGRAPGSAARADADADADAATDSDSDSCT